MCRRRLGILVLGVLGCLVLLPAGAAAQGAIAGQVTDNTGGVLPGVTVEATSPVLIEGARVVVTDGQGRYTIVDLRPGTYRVMFTLAGFTTAVREGIVLTAGFTAPVDVQLSVGAIEESVTVSGVSPVVDVQSAQRQQVMTRELLENVPTGRSIWAYGATVPSIQVHNVDVGGSQGTQQVFMASHGAFPRENALQVDGMSIKSLESDGAWNHYHNVMMFQEVSYETTGSGAEISGAGIRMNMIPKEGGNAFSGQVFLSYLPGDWGSDNVTPELKARGLQAAGQVHRVFDYNPSVGGPILRDRLWFFSSYRRWGSDTFQDNSFYNLDPTRRLYQADFSRQTIDDNLLKAGMTRLTLQVAQRHKFAAYLDRTSKFRGHECQSRMAEEACGVRYPRLYYTSQAKYTGTLSSRLLVEGGFSLNNFTWSNNERQPHVKNTDIPRFDRTLGTRWSSRHVPARFWSGPRFVLTGSTSYVSGSHAFKAGVQFDWGTSENWLSLGETGVVDLVQEYLNGQPASVSAYNTPLFFSNKLNHELAFYVQDAWTIDRLTISPGLRVEWVNSSIPPQTSGAGRFVPARTFAPEDCLPCWGPDVSPRLAVAYDLFGTAKTALKASVGRYMQSVALGFAADYNPMRSANDRRTWTDLNGDDIAQDNEIGRVNRPFDLVGLRTRNPDPDIKRPYQWEASAGIQQEVAPGVSVSASWMRRTWRRLFWRENLLASHADYTPIPIQNPITPSETILVYSLDRAKLGLVNELDRNSKKNKKWNNAFDIDLTARVRGASVFAGLSFDRQITVTCEVADPNYVSVAEPGLRFCDQSAFGMPYRTMFKAAGTYPLPYGVEVSGSLQSHPGGSHRIFDGRFWQQVEYNVTRSVLPTLTQSSVTMQLIQPGTKYLPRWYMADVRLGKVFEVGEVRLRGQFDIYNVTNSNSILDMNETYGPALDRVDRILPGRVYGFSLRTDF